MPSELSLVQSIAIWALPVVFAITFHELAHGYVARALGDDTAAKLGRLSINPLRHVDPVGTVLVPVVLLALGGFLFGWAKPVPVAMARLRHPRRDMAMVAAAGPAANLAMAFLWAVLLRLLLGTEDGSGVIVGLRYVAVAGVAINLFLMVLNLLPVPPLDGSRVLAGLLPEHLARRLDRIEPYGLLVVLALLASGLLGRLLEWPLMLAEGLVLGLAGVSSSSLY